MKKLILIILSFVILFLNYGCEDNCTESNNNDSDTTSLVDKKPNLYIYPNQTLNLSIQIRFPNGGDVLESIPQYNNSWNITVNPNGKINDLYDYLYYECEMTDLTQKEFGWIVEQINLKDFFITNLSASGFNQKEINDFTDYWIPLLTDYNFYEIYPQYNSTLKEMIEIEFSIVPENFYRLHYLIKGRDNEEKHLLTPKIETAKRDNYFAVEWGVIID